MCINIVGSYTCQCSGGYQGDGRNCTGLHVIIVCWICIMIVVCVEKACFTLCKSSVDDSICRYFFTDFQIPHGLVWDLYKCVSTTHVKNTHSSFALRELQALLTHTAASWSTLTDILQVILAYWLHRWKPLLLQQVTVFYFKYHFEKFCLDYGPLLELHALLLICSWYYLFRVDRTLQQISENCDVVTSKQ